MGKSKIDWLARPGTIPWSWNFIAGCTKVGIGCQNCYALGLSWRLIKAPNGPERYKGTVEREEDGTIDWTGQVNCDLEALEAPTHWKKARTVFVCSMADLWHHAVPHELQHRAFELMEEGSQHTFIVLTKRPLQWDARCLLWGRTEPSPNVWGVVSASTQAEAHAKVYRLMEVPLAVRGLSAEPLMGRISLSGQLAMGLDWLIIGCESGPSRSLGQFGSPWGWQEAAATLVRQCRRYEIPVFVKQVPLKTHQGHKQGWVVSRKPEEWPEELRVREWPG
jgi:protein gp37